MRGQEAAIDLLERQALAQVRLRPAYRHLLTVSGIGQVLGLGLGLAIILETGSVERNPAIKRCGGALQAIPPRCSGTRMPARRVEPPRARRRVAASPPPSRAVAAG